MARVYHGRPPARPSVGGAATLAVLRDPSGDGRPGARPLERGAMRRSLSLAALGLLAALAACSKPVDHPYPDEVVEAFMASCQAQRGTTVASCACSIEKLQRAFTLDEFRAFEQRLAKGEAPSEMFNVIAECRGS